MRYYLSYKGEVFGYAITKEEAETKLKRLSGTIVGVEIKEFDNKVIPMSRRKFVNSKAQKKPRT